MIKPPWPLRLLVW
jgi:hypothetical protein